MALDGCDSVEYFLARGSYSVKRMPKFDLAGKCDCSAQQFGVCPDSNLRFRIHLSTETSAYLQSWQDSEVRRYYFFEAS